MKGRGGGRPKSKKTLELLHHVFVGVFQYVPGPPKHVCTWSGLVHLNFIGEEEDRNRDVECRCKKHKDGKNPCFCKKKNLQMVTSAIILMLDKELEMENEKSPTNSILANHVDFQHLPAGVS